MIPISFDEETNILDPPPGMSLEHIECLSVYKGQLKNGLMIYISRWKLTKEELEEINRTGKLWLIVLGDAMPPVKLQTEYPFIKE